MALAAWAVAAIVSVAISTVSVLVQRKRLKDSEPQGKGFEIERFGQNHPLYVIYGEREVNGTIIYQGVRDLGADDVDNNVLFVCIVWGCTGPEGYEAIDEVYFDDRPWRDYRGASVWSHLGKGSHNPPSFWEAPDDWSGIKGEKLCLTYIRLAHNNKMDRYPNGRPQFRAKIRGNRILDPRTGNYGFIDNPALILLDYLKSKDYGKGLLDNQVDTASFLTSANFCDQQVPIPDYPSYKNQFTCNVPIGTDAKLLDNVKQILTGFRGELIKINGLMFLQIERDATSVMSFNQDDYIGELNSSSVQKSDKINQFVLRYPDKNARWETAEAIYPEPDSEEDLQYLAEDYEIRLSSEKEFDTITNSYEALQMAELLLKQARDGITVNFKAAPKAQQLDPGDVIDLTDQLRGWIRKPFRINEITINGDGTVDIAAVEHQVNIYPWSSKPNAPSYPDTSFPNPFDVPEPQNLIVDQDLEGHQVKFRWSGDLQLGFDVQVLNDAQMVMYETETVNHYVYIDFLPVGTYSFQVRAFNGATASDWVTKTETITTEPLSELIPISGRYYETRYKKAQSKPAQPTGAFPAGWTTYAPPYTYPDRVWASTAFKEVNGDLVTGTNWSDVVQWSGEKGQDGDPGVPGQRGAGTFSRGVTGLTTWSDQQAQLAVTDGVPVTDDIVTLYQSENKETGYRETRRYTGSAWVAYDYNLHGSVLVEGTVDVIGGRIEVRSSDTGERIEISNDAIVLYDENGNETSRIDPEVISFVDGYFEGVLYARRVLGGVSVSDVFPSVIGTVPGRIVDEWFDLDYMDIYGDHTGERTGVFQRLYFYYKATNYDSWYHFRILVESPGIAEEVWRYDPSKENDHTVKPHTFTNVTFAIPKQLNKDDVVRIRIQMIGNKFYTDHRAYANGGRTNGADDQNYYLEVSGASGLKP